MSLEKIRQELIGRSVQVALLNLEGKLVESDHSLISLRSIEGGDVFEKIDALFGLRETVNALSPGDPPLLMPIVHFKVGTEEALLNLEIHRREDDFLMVFFNHERVLSRLRSMQQERNDSMILLERIQKQEKQLRAANEKLKAANEELDRFAYVVSHDLKSPLRGIRNLAEWIEEGLEAGDLQELEAHVRLISERSTRMEHLIDAILKYSRAGRQNLPPKEVDVAGLISEFIEQFDTRHTIQLELPETLPVLNTQVTWLYQVFSNLLSNAVKYGKISEDGPLRITIDHQEFENHHQFSITDHGPGIPEEHHKRIFEIFETLGGGENYEQTGIGLSIVKKLVKEAGGKIWLESTPGQGATFSFTWGKA